MSTYDQKKTATRVTLAEGKVLLAKKKKSGNITSNCRRIWYKLTGRIP